MRRALMLLLALMVFWLAVWVAAPETPSCEK